MWVSRTKRFSDRSDAGRVLARLLGDFRESNGIVLGLPRGGVIVAAEIAHELGLPLDVMVVRKLGLPFSPEVAMGAIAEGGLEYLDRRLIAAYGVGDDAVSRSRATQRDLLESRASLYRRGRSRLDLRGRTVIVVDDGIATGATARVACRAARNEGARDIALAVPVGAADTLGRFADADRVACPRIVKRFVAVGHHYESFTQTTDDEVIAALDPST